MIDIDSRDYTRVTLCLATGSFLLFANLYLFQPILPELSVQFSLSATETNWIFAASTFTLAAMLLLWSSLSEAYGRKRIMMIGLVVPVILNVFLLLTPGYWSLLVIRALSGATLAAFAAVAMAYMAEELSPLALNKAVGGYIAANTLGGISGRLCGGILTDWFDWQTALASLTLLSLIGTVFIYKYLPVERHFTAKRLSFAFLCRQLAQHFSNKMLVSAMLIGGLNFGLLINLYSVTIYRFSEPPFRFSGAVSSSIFLCYLGGTLTSALSSRWLSRFSLESGIRLGIGVYMLGLIAAIPNSAILILLALILFSSAGFLYTLWPTVMLDAGRKAAKRLLAHCIWCFTTPAQVWVALCC